MGSRRPYEPFQPIPSNILGTRLTQSAKVTAITDERLSMNNQLPNHGSQSGSSNSPYGALEDYDTDDSFGRRMIQEMNQERVQNETRNRRPQAFRKARTHPRVGLTLENLERVAPNNNMQSHVPSYSSPGSISSGPSDPPLNVPREWGRMGRKNSDWLRRITMESPGNTERDGAVQGIDWASAAADVPLPSLEDSPSSRRGSTRGTPAASIRRQVTSVERVEDWDFNADLTEGSLFESTPAPGPRNTALDDIRQRELEAALEDSIYPTPPRDTSQPRVLKSEPSSSLADTWAHPAEQEVALSKRPERVKTTLSTNITSSGPPSPIAVSKSSHTVGHVNRAVTPQVQISPQRPIHRREDSQDILRRLARASSNTPSPVSSAMRRVTPKGAPGRNRAEPTVDSTAPLQAPRNPKPRSPARAPTRPQTPPLMEIDLDVPRKNEETQESPEEQEVIVDETPMPSSPARRLNPKTPVVTGAWIDTPKNIVPRRSTESITRSPRRSPAKKAAEAVLQRSTEDPPKMVLEPQSSTAMLPSSALSAVVDEARLHRGEENGEMYGEATIESLEDLMAPPNNDDSSFQELDEDTLDNLQLPPGKPKTAAEKQRLAELLTLKNMNMKLKAARGNIRNARDGIQRVENQVHASEGQHNAKEKEKEQLILEYHSQDGKCIQCGNQDVLLALWSSITSRFYYWEEGTSKFKLTKFGLACVVFWMWFLVESVMCLIYCQPLYSTSPAPPPPPAEIGWPTPPFVLPTVIFRPVRPLWRPVLDTVYTFVHYLWTFVFGESEEAKFWQDWVARMELEKMANLMEEMGAEEWSMSGDEIL